MGISLGGLAFDDLYTTVKEQHAETGGREGRQITITGLITGETSVEAVEARLDAIVAAVPGDDTLTALSLRPGRRLWVRRTEFSREVARHALGAAFTLQLQAPNPFEESIGEHAATWSISASEATCTLVSEGTVPAPTVIAIMAEGRLVNPSFGTDTALLAYEGVVETGRTLVIDGYASRVLLDGEDVTPYTTGTFPGIAPEGTALTYRDDGSSAHLCTATISYRDRWW